MNSAVFGLIGMFLRLFQSNPTSLSSSSIYWFYLILLIVDLFQVFVDLSDLVIFADLLTVPLFWV